MPFPRPTLTELRARAAAEINAALPGADALLRFSNLGVTGQVQAGFSHLHFGYLDWIAKQATPFTSDDEFLAAWAALKGLLKKPAAPAVGAAQFTGTNGVVLASGTPIIRSDGLAYTTTADASAISGTLTAPVIAAEGGAGGNAAAGTGMKLVSAVAGLSPTGVVTTALAGGYDVETDDALRTRMLQAYAAGGQGGSAADYVTWALAIPVVTRAWCRPREMGPGTVVVYVALDTVRPNGVPVGTTGVATAETRAAHATGDQLMVADALYPQQPAQALVYVRAGPPSA